MKKLFLFLFFILIFATCTLATSNTIHILTVSELEDESLQGGVASLDLEIKQGSGSIFIESFPLSNIDTQAVTRIATDIACSYAQANCEELDFFYTIRTNSGLVRGPSAGGATALLALTTLKGIPIEDVAMTGGISSAGLITTVGGVKEKVIAAVDEDISTIFIPSLSLNITDNQTNISPLYLEDIQTNPATVYDISSLSQAYFILTGNPLPAKSIDDAPVYYTKQMRETANLLCTRTQDLLFELEEKNLEVSNQSLDFYNKSIETQVSGDYYSSASFCYSANLRLREQLVENLSMELREENLNRLNDSILFFEEQIDDYTLRTFSDLEAYIIVKERIYEAKEYVDAINLSNISHTILASGIERYYSAVAWSEFFGLNGEPLQIDETSLELACIQEIKEAEARSNYLKTTLPEYFLEEMLLQLNGAYEQYNDDNYPLCIFKASKAKATAHLFMNGINDDEQVPAIFEVKQQRAEELIALQQEQGNFPIIGYSYYEYANQLIDDQPYTALLFMEYAITMGDISNYFPKSRQSFISESIFSELFYLLLGAVIGFIVAKLTSKESNTGGERKVKKASSKKKSK